MSRSAGSHGLDLRQRDLLALAPAAEQFALPDRGGVMRTLGAAEHTVDSGKNARAIFFEGVEGAGRRQTFEHPPVDRTRVHARREVGKVGELAILARGDDLLHRLLADAFKRGQARR